MRRCGGTLISRRLCLPVKITKSSGVFLSLLVNLMVTVALVGNLVGLLHSDGAVKSSESTRLAVLFQNSIKKITKATELRAFCYIPLHN